MFNEKNEINQNNNAQKCIHRDIKNKNPSRTILRLIEKNVFSVFCSDLKKNKCVKST